MRFLLLLFTLFTCSAFATVSKDKIYVIANSHSADSKSIAEYYCQARGIPKKNIIMLDMPDTDALKRVDYQTKLANPLIDELIKRKAISAETMLVDSETKRPNYLFISHDIDYIVLCKLPFKILPFSKSRGFTTDASSVDSELSATFLQMKKLNGLVRNPLYKNYNPETMHKTYGVLRVARLDGKNFDEAKTIIDSAISAEKNGVRGRAYIDKNKSGGGYKIGNDWLTVAEEVLKKMDFDITIDSASALMGYEQRFDAPAFFFGWYNGTPQSYFVEKDFKAPVGAVGLHLYSFSASYLRRMGWTTVMISNGFSQTFGNVYEPYLTGTQDIGAIMKAYENGLSAGEVAYASIAILSWQSLVIGDPLYRPFAVSLEEQMRRIEKGEIDSLSQYVILRQVNKFKREGKSEAECIEFVKKYVGKMPDTALIWRIIESSVVDKNNAEVSKYALILHSRKIWRDVQFMGLSMEFADVCGKIGMPELAMDIYNKLGEMKISKNFLRSIVICAEGLSRKSGISLSDKFVELKKTYDIEDAKKKAEAEKKKAEQEKKKKNKK